MVRDEEFSTRSPDDRVSYVAIINKHAKIGLGDVESDFSARAIALHHVQSLVRYGESDSRFADATFSDRENENCDVGFGLSPVGDNSCDEEDRGENVNNNVRDVDDTAKHRDDKKRGGTIDPYRRVVVT